MIAAPESIDVGFTLACAAAVLLMQAGFCMLESGLVRTKNSINVAVKNVLDCAISTLVFALIGFAMMFGPSVGGWIGSTDGLSIIADGKLTTFFLFQMVFCSTAATIVSGAVAERTRLGVYVMVAAVVSGLIYPTFGHWAWGGVLEGTGSGWLAAAGFVDYAGCVVVHVVGGFAALAAARAVGRRRHLRRRDITGGHSLTLSILGCFLLWFGWWGFNGGSGLAVDELLPKVLLNTNLAAAAGGLTAAVWTLTCGRRIQVGPLINGILAGLVAITGACHAVGPLAAVLSGFVGAIVCLATERFVLRLGIDDAVSAFAVHGAAGVWGAAVFALLSPLDALPAGDRWMQLFVQLGAASIAGAMSYGVVAGVLRLARCFFRLRVRAGEERVGLNMAEHGATCEVIDLIGSMHAHEVDGDYAMRLQVDPHTEVGQIAGQYNRVLDRVEDEMHKQRTANTSLEQERLRLRSVLENAGVGIYQLDTSGRFLSANNTLLRVLDCPDASALMDGKHATLLPWHRVGDEIATQVREAFERGHELRDLESQITTDTGISRWVLESFVPIRDESGRLVCFLGTVHDVTDRKQAMIAEVEIAEAKSQAKGEFLANMSHEIRTPLNGVIGMLDLLCSFELEDQVGHYASVARSSADTLLSLINNVLDFSKIEAGRLELEEIEFDLRETVEQTAEQFAVMAHRKGLEMNCHVAEDIARGYRGDPERLRQVIINLLGNAIKFTECGEINLMVKHAGHRIRFAVQDTGIGMRREVQDKLFGAFTQADASTTRQYGGTGLGLAISSQLVNLMGGSIVVESIEGQGSTFSFDIELPVVDRERSDNSLSLRLAALPRGSRVLVVDDNATNCEILSTQLGLWGFEVTVCQQPTVALERMQVAQRLGKPFDLVILDYCMPELDGEGVARRIRSEPRFDPVPILMLSSSHELLSSSELADAGIQIALTKPARQSRLLDAVTTLLFDPDGQETLAGSSAAKGSSKPNGLQVNKPTTPPIGSQSPPIAAPQAATVAERPHKADVLVAEDNEVNQLVIEQMLRQIGLSCEVVENGRKAVECVIAGKYGLVLMDGHMPILDGLAATAEIRRWEMQSGCERTRIVALTANVVAGVRQQCLDAGMDDYLCKPITLATLQDAVAFLGQGSSASNPTDLTISRAADLSPSVAARIDPLPETSPTSAEQVTRQSSPFDEGGWAEEVVRDPMHNRSGNTTAESVASRQKSEQPAAVNASFAPAESDGELLNREMLVETCGGDDDFAKQILGIMQQTLPERLRDIASAKAEGDYARVRAVAHQLKGAAGDSALVAVYDSAAEVERCALERDVEGVSSEFESLKQRVESTHQLLERVLETDV